MRTTGALCLFLACTGGEDTVLGQAWMTGFEAQADIAL